MCNIDITSQLYLQCHIIHFRVCIETENVLNTCKLVLVYHLVEGKLIIAGFRKRLLNLPLVRILENAGAVL